MYVACFHKTLKKISGVWVLEKEETLCASTKTSLFKVLQETGGEVFEF